MFSDPVILNGFILNFYNCDIFIEQGHARALPRKNLPIFQVQNPIQYIETKSKKLEFIIFQKF
jgi:hypothetical protein